MASLPNFDDKQIEQALADVESPLLGWWLVSPCRKLPTRSLHCTDNYALVESAFFAF